MLNGEIHVRDPATLLNYANKYKKICDRVKNW